MAWAKKCDRCGKYFDWQREETSGFEFLTYNHVNGKYCVDNEEYDLCPKCVEYLYDWIDRKEKL